MSINDFANKIKKNLNIDTMTVMCLFAIVGVGIGAFGLGRLSMSDTSGIKNEEIQIIDKRNLSASVNNIVNNSVSNTTDNNLKEKRYVASKNGKLYYSLNCSGSKRIAEKNMIWFNSKEEAEKSGYEYSSSCK